MNIIGFGVNTLDHIILTKGFPNEDEKSLGFEKTIVQAGGPIPNALVGLSRLGHKTSYLGKTSFDSEGEQIIKSLEQEGIDISGIQRTAKKANLSYIISNEEKGTRTIIWRKIPKEDFYESRNMPHEKIKEADIVLVDGLEKESSENIVKYAKKENKKIIYGTESTRNINVLLPYIDILVAPESTIYKFYNKNLSKEEIAETMQESNIEQIFVTKGEEGSYGIHCQTGKIQEFPAFKINVIDSTGAGDAYLAGIVHAYAKGKNLSETLSIASATAAINCLSLGGREGLPRENELRKFLDNTDLEMMLK